MGSNTHARQTMRTNPNVGILTAVMLAVAWTGCGGGPDATGVDGTAIESAGGENVNVVAHRHWEEAIAMFETHDGEAGTWTAENCEQTLGKFNEANGAQGGNFTEAIYMMGVVSGRCGNLEQALQYYQQALATNAQYCGALVGVGIGDVRAGNKQQARRRFESAIEHDNQCTAAYVNLAILQRENPNEVREALNNLRRALAIESDYLPAFNQMALLYYEQASDNAQMLDLAEVVCRQAQLINGNYAPIYNSWGLINVRQGNIIAALAKFQRAIQLDENFYEAYMNFGQLTLSYRGYQDASQAFAKAHELRPQDYDAVIGLGAALRGLNELDRAEAQYQAAIQLDAARPEAYFNLGLLYQSYKGGEEPALNRAKGFYEQFVERARGERYTEARDAVTRTCRRLPQRMQRRLAARGRNTEWADGCTPGRVQQIDEARRIMGELREMQQQMEQMQQQQQPAPEEGAAAPAEGG